ncbi:MAG: aminoacyl-tRNA hydrolase [Chloroflexi bacterium]|nr:aminoacyl-tRNA hydrolase [Chloroflexota bacterium]MCI0578127.1 aminoacyl-tRNA hydrolase [Chloroflexota bacterium]MCI0645183.1 aminoacyl-tRNA hydrolase [Chloroflexota bacterium]MCI0728281.1 aminoacyl-tRNA hydrolase [Chloroflexota bacterium]
MDDENVIRINDQVAISRSELSFRFSTSSGPGGQHVNKAETQVTLLFDVARSPSLDETIRQRLLARLATRLDKDGVLQISVQESRSQHQNRETAVARFQALLAEALKVRKKRRKSRPGQAAVERRLAEKKQRSQLKKNRGQKWE